MKGKKKAMKKKRERNIERRDSGLSDTNDNNDTRRVSPCRLLIFKKYQRIVLCHYLQNHIT